MSYPKSHNHNLMIVNGPTLNDEFEIKTFRNPENARPFLESKNYNSWRVVPKHNPYCFPVVSGTYWRKRGAFIKRLENE